MGLNLTLSGQSRLMYGMVPKFHDRSFLYSAILCTGMLLAWSGIGKDDNSSTLSELDLAKRDAEDFAKLAKLIKPSVVVIESVDRLGRGAVEELASLSPRTV